MKLSTISFVDGFYVKPRIDLDTLAKYSEGLICCSACLAGHIPSALLRGDYEEAKEYVRSKFEEMGDMTTFESIFVDDGYERRDRKKSVRRR